MYDGLSLPPLPHRSKESVCCDYETMLKNQSSRLSELDAEREELHAHNTELEARVRDLEMRLGKVTSARDRLNERVEELTATLQGEGETIVTCRMEVHLAQLMEVHLPADGSAPPSL